MKFFKRLMCIVLSLMMLSGCELMDTSDDLVVSHTTFVPPVKTEQATEEYVPAFTEAENVDNGGAKDPEAQGWELRDILLYSVNGSSNVDTFDPSGEPLRLVKPGVKYDYNKMVRFINDNAYFKKHFVFSETIRDTAEYAEFGDYGQHAKAFVEKLICGQKMENYSKDADVLYSDLMISVGQDYNTYDEPNNFTVMLNTTHVTYGFQLALYELLAQQIGAETAEYIIYAKTIEEGVPELDLYDTIPSADGYGNLVIQRKITGGSFLLNVDFQDNSEFDEERFAYYDHAYKPLYNSCRFSLSDVFQGDFGGNDPTNDLQFFTVFMQSGGIADGNFKKTLKDNILVISNEGMNKINRIYTYNMRLVKDCDMEYEEAPSFSCNINSYFDSRTNNNRISGTGSFISGFVPCEYFSEEDAVNMLLEAASEKLKCLFPCVDANNISYSGNMEKTISLSGSYTATTYNIPVSVTVRINPYIRYGQEEDEDGNMIDNKDDPLLYYVMVNFDLA